MDVDERGLSLELVSAIKYIYAKDR
jgi:hypothetical protein